jgi:hypothetical protein
MPTKTPQYLIYLLKFWQVETEDGPTWRAVVEDPQSDERKGFADLNKLHAFLTQKLAGTAQLPSNVELSYIEQQGEER